MTVIGLGLMGQAIASTFLKAGHPTTVWNRTRSKADLLVAEGARLAPTVGDAFKAGSLTVICVTDYQAVHELIGAVDVELDGTMLINLTSGSSAQAREAARSAEQLLNAWLQGTALVRTAGVDAVTYAPFAKQIAAGVAEWLSGYAQQIDSGSFPAEVSALETDARAMAHLIEESEALGVNAELPKLIRAMADRSIAAGHGGEQYPVLIEEFGKPRND